MRGKDRRRKKRGETTRARKREEKRGKKKQRKKAKGEKMSGGYHYPNQIAIKIGRYSTRYLFMRKIEELQCKEKRGQVGGGRGLSIKEIK